MFELLKAFGPKHGKRVYKLEIQIEKLIKLELDVCLNLKFWNSTKLKIDEKWARLNTKDYLYVSKFHFGVLTLHKIVGLGVATTSWKLLQISEKLSFSPLIMKTILIFWSDEPQGNTRSAHVACAQ